MQSTEIGHFAIVAYGTRFELTPSLANMSKLADAKRLINIFNLMHSKQVPNNVLIDVAREIILACSDSPEIDEYLVRIRRGKPLLRKKMLSMNDQVVIAAALMRHGVSGVNKPKFEGSDKKSSKPMTEFDVNKIVADAMIHFGLSRSEALSLTMSEFYLLLASHRPPQKKEGDAPDIEEHKSLMARIAEAE